MKSGASTVAGLEIEDAKAGKGAQLCKKGGYISIPRTKNKQFCLVG